jgi:hypothetical protein
MPAKGQLDDADDRPWEQPGAFRLDCEPHRGNLLRFLGGLSLLLGVASVGGFACVPLAAPMALVASGIGAAVNALACRDLRAMDAGRRDPRRRKQTRDARTRARVGLICGLLVSLLTKLDRNS